MDSITLFERTDRQSRVGSCLNPALCEIINMLRNIINTLFGTGRKTEVHQEPIISEADSVKDSISETPIPQLSVEEEIEVLAAHIGGIASGMTIEIELRELLGILDRKRKKADSYYQLKKHLKEDNGVELIITSRTSKSNKEGEV